MTSNNASTLLDITVKKAQYGGIGDSLLHVENDQELHKSMATILGIGVSQLRLAILISVATMVVSACHMIVLPIYLKDIADVNGDPYVVVLVFRLSCSIAFILITVFRWCYTREKPLLSPNSRYMAAAVIGFLSVLHAILGGFGSLPDRTRPELLGVLSAATLPNTVICRYVIMRKAVGFKRILCTAVVFLGLFVSLIPEIFKLGSEDKSLIHEEHHIDTYLQPTYNGTNHTTLHVERIIVYGWVWPLVLVGRTLLSALSLVIVEQQVKAPEVSYLTLVFWAEIFNSVSLVALFWMALIPNFGINHNFNEFLSAIGRGFSCSFSTDPSCRGCLVSFVIFIFNSPCVEGFSILLTKYAEGAIYTVMVMSISRTVGALFWTLFIDTDANGLLWKPRFNLHTILTFVGLLIIVPSTCFYAFLSTSKERTGDSEENLKSTSKK